MRGANFLALLLILLGVILFWLAQSGNYKQAWLALKGQGLGASGSSGGNGGLKR